MTSSADLDDRDYLDEDEIDLEGVSPSKKTSVGVFVSLNAYL